MKRITPLLSLSLILVACQAPQQPLQSPAVPTAQTVQTLTAQQGAQLAPVVIQKSPVLAPVERKPEGKIKVQGSTVNVEIQLPALPEAFKTQALDLAGDNATHIVATVSDSHGKTYTPDGADGNDKVSYPANGMLNLSFSNVVPDQVLIVELQVEDDGNTDIPQAHLASAVSQTTANDVNATINYQTTPTALAMKALIANDADRARAIDLAALVTKMEEITGISGTSPNFSYTTHPSLVDTAQLATDLASDQPADLNAADYRLVGATVDLTVNGLVGNDKVEVDVTDAASVRATNVGASGTITGATPGNGLKVKVGAQTGNSTQYTFAINPTTVDLTNNSSTPVTITATPVAVTLTDMTPSSGEIGTSVTLGGTGFSTVAANNTVKFGSITVPSGDITVNGTGTEITAVVPAGTFGSQNVTIQVGSQTSNAMSYEVKPKITSLSTTATTVGTSMTITGTGFSTTAGDNTVRFGSESVSSANVSVNGAGTVLTVTVPGSISGSQPVTVQVGNQTSDSSAFNVVPVLNALAVSNATPDTTLTLTGSGFSTTLSANSVSFGGTTVNPATVNPAGTSMTVVVPNVSGSMNLNVTVAGQNSVNRTFESIPKITTVTPNTGSTNNTITLVGKGFSSTPGNNTVKLGTIDASVTAASSTSLTVTVPETPAKTADATVQVGNQTSASAGFSILPHLSSLTTASTSGGKAVLIRSQLLTITGTNFDPEATNNTVKFGTLPAVAVASASATEITVVVPSGVDTPGDVNVSVITNAQTSNTLVGTVPSITLNINNGGFH